MEYKVITASSENALGEFVNRWLADGWHLHGGVACSMTYDNDGHPDFLFAQAIVFYTHDINGEPVALDMRVAHEV